MTPEIINVAIADDHKIFRRGVILSLKTFHNIRFILEAENGEELIKGLEKEQPDVVLMDLKMPVKDGIETTKYLNKHYPKIRIY
jgi:DNA-binding NarL/FixJ family response regulator